MEMSGLLCALAALPPRNNPDTNGVGEYGSYTVVLDVLEKWKLVCPCRESNQVPSRL